MFDWLLAALVAAAPATEALLEAADQPRAAFRQSVVHVRLTVRQPDRPDVLTEFDLHVGGEDRQLIVFTDPRNRGRRLLLRGAKAWLFTPGTTHPVPISANQRLAGGASYAEIARVRLAGDYRGTLRAEPEPCLMGSAGSDAGETCRVADITAVARSAPYPAGTLWLDPRGLVRRAEYLHASGKPAKSVTHEYREQDGRVVLARSVIRDRLNADTDQATIIDYLDYRRESQPESMFDPPPPAETGQSPR